jgi:hypothetical protein
MRQLLMTLTVLTLFAQKSIGQDFNSIIAKVADTLAKKIVATEKKKVAIVDFVNNNESITQLGTFLSEEVSAELANLTDNQKKFTVLERSKLEQIFEEKDLIQSTDGSKMAKKLGKLSVANILIFATITDFDGYYRVVIKLLDTKDGDALSSYKVNFVKTPSLENLNKQIVKKGMQTDTEEKKEEVKQTEKPKVEEVKEVGDICFTCKSFYEYNLSVTIYKVKSDEIEKVINVSKNETTCAYELPAGVHKVELKWIFNDGSSNGRVDKTEQKEIRIQKGKTQTIEYNKGY